MPYLDLADRRIFYNDTGSGPPLILLHNGFYSSESWTPVRSAFAERFRVIDYDRYGYGKSTRYRAPTSELDIVEDGADELFAIMDALSIDTAHLVGHCLGGASALVFAAKHPARVTHIVAEAVGYFTDHKILLATDMTLTPYDTIETSLRTSLAAMHGEDYAEVLWAHLRDHKASYIMNPAYDIRKIVFGIKAPLLIVNGDRDFYFDVAHPLSVFKKMRRTASLWIVPETGHDIHMERPAAFVDEVCRFFATNANSPNIS